MGLFDQIAGSLLGGQAGTSSPLVRSALDLLGGVQGGGLGGLVQAFQQNGLGHLMDSWIGTGQNLPVTPAQIQQVLGPRVQQLAEQHGTTPDAVSRTLAQVLPGLVDHLTPDGQLPQGGVAAGLSALRAKLGL